MVTDLITFKADRKFIKEVDKSAKFAGFHNRTEFIRGALRDKMSEIEKERAIKALMKLRGIGNPKDSPTEQEYEKNRERTFNVPLEESEKKLQEFLRSLRNTNI